MNDSHLAPPARARGLKRLPSAIVRLRLTNVFSRSTEAHERLPSPISPWWIAALLLFAAAGALSSVLPPLVVVMLVTLSGVWLAVSVDVATLVLPLLLIRSATDSIMDLFTLFSGTPLEMNLAGALNSFTLGLGLAYAVRRWLIADQSGRRHVILDIPGAWWSVSYTHLTMPTSDLV